MITLLGSLVAVVLLSQASGESRARGTVVDDQGKPIGFAKVVLHAPPTAYSGGDPAETSAVCDSFGRFSVKGPPPGRTFNGAVRIWAYRPGLAIAAVPYETGKPHQIVLRKLEHRTVKIMSPEGQAIAGARVEAQMIFVPGGTANWEVPTLLASPLAAVTASDGRATLTILGARDRLVGARVTASAIGEQVLAVQELKREDSSEPAFLIKLEKTGRLEGRIIDEHGEGVANQVVEIWSRGGQGGLLPKPVGFNNGRVRTRTDGTFQTPDTLFIGASYRIAVGAPGREPNISDWIEIKTEAATEVSLELRALRKVTGWLIDWHGVVVPNALVFQSGNGTPRTAVMTDGEGRFALDGFPQGPAFLFARGEGFRFQMQRVRAGDHDIAVKLTGAGERPEHELRRLASPIPIEESRSMARRILDRWWQAAVDQRDEDAKALIVQLLIPADPEAALGKISAVQFPTEESRGRLQSFLAVALARTNFEKGESLAPSITDAGLRAGTLALLADLVPRSDRLRKLAILERALVQAKATSVPSDRVYRLGQVAGRLHELDEITKAEQIFAEGLRQAKQFKDVSSKRRLFEAVLARFDLVGAMELAKQLSGDEAAETILLSSIALGLSWDVPWKADQFLSRYPPRPGRNWLTPLITWKIAAVDPLRAAQLIETCRDQPNYFEHEFCLALGSKGRDETIKIAAIQAGLQGLDRALDEEPDALMQYGGELMAISEAIEPALVAEVMCRAIAARPLTGNPRAIKAYVPSELLAQVAWYDRGLAAALLEPAVARVEKSRDGELIDADAVFLAWTLCDPRAAVARLERVPMTSVKPEDNRLRIRVVESLVLAMTRTGTGTQTEEVAGAMVGLFQGGRPPSEEKVEQW